MSKPSNNNQFDTIICGDAVAEMAKLPERSVDLVITSPPYDDLRSYNGYTFSFEEVAYQLWRVIKEGGVMVWVVGDQTVNGSETGTSFKQALGFKDMGFRLHDTMIYHKVGLTLNHNRYEQEFEYMFVLSKGKPKTFNPIKIPTIWFGKDSDRTGQKYGEHNEINKKLRSGKDRGNIKPDKIMGNVWRFDTGYGHSSKDKRAFDHPAIFPEKLVSRHIISWSNPGDLVLDPFNGSGTTTKMAHKLGREYIGIDISEEYCAIAESRLKQQVLL